MNDVHEDTPVVFETRWAMSYLRGPLTRDQIKVLTEPLKEQSSPMPSQPLPVQAGSASTPQSIGLKATLERPALSPDVRQFFAPVGESQLKNVGTSALTYKPMIIGAAQVRFVDSKTKIDTTKDTPCPLTGTIQKKPISEFQN
jgi:hypothetical protein